MAQTATQSTSRSDEGARAPVAQAVLTFLLDCDRPKRGSTCFSLEGVQTLQLGRGDALQFSASSLTLPDKRVSSNHARLTREGDEFTLTDLGSANGTRVGGEKIKSVRLAPGDILQLGHSLLAFERKLLTPGLPFELGSKTRVVTLNGNFARSLSQLARIAATPIPLLLLGESGTGKEVLARVTHELSGRPGPFVPVNCGALPESLVESHLFGHKKGSFSGAVSDEPGLVRSANHGTLFLDEIGDLPAASQAALLRVLQESEVLPVGATRAEKVELRVIAATHRSLAEMQVAGTFRSDLFARLAGFSLSLPTVRERREDLGQLIAQLLQRDHPSVSLRPEAAMQLFRYEWPLNVRELAQTLATAAALTSDGVIRLEHLPKPIAECRAPLSLLNADSEFASPSQRRPLSAEEAQLKAELTARLAASGGNVSAVARELGKARQQVQRWMRRFDLK